MIKRPELLNDDDLNAVTGGGMNVATTTGKIKDVKVEATDSGYKDWIIIQ